MLALGGWFGQTSIWAAGWVPLWQVQPLVHLGPKAAGWWLGPSNGLPSAEGSQAPSRSNSATTPSSLLALPPMAYFLCLRWLSFRSLIK